MADKCPSASVQFEELYVHYHDSIYRYLYRLVARTDPASDLTQDVFVQLHRHLQGDMRLKNPRAWLYAVATNLGYNHLRREQRLMKLILKWPPFLNRTLSPEQKYARDEQYTLALEAVSRLPLREQILLQLFQDGLTFAEIAAALKMNPASVGKLLARAIEKCAHWVRR